MSYDRLAPTISSKAKKLFGSGNMGQNNWCPFQMDWTPALVKS